MHEPEKTPTIEEKIAVVDSWVASFEEVAKGNAEIHEIEPQLLRDVLTYFGAEFDPGKEGYSKLRQSTNKWRRPGMNAVWGEDYMSRYNRWTNDWAEKYEERTGKNLPKLQKSGSKVSGMRHWFGELTSYAAEQITFVKYKEKEEIRLYNGYARATGKVLDEATFLADNKGFPGSIPPGFAGEGWEKIKSKALKNPAI